MGAEGVGVRVSRLDYKKSGLERRILDILVVMNIKVCAKCKQEKSKSEFYKQARSKDGLHSYCKACTKGISKANYEVNGERLRAKHREWLAANRERVNDYQERYSRGEKGNGRGAYARIYQSGLRRDDFESNQEFARALTRATSKNLQQRNRFYIDELKKTPCTDCGQTFDPVCMDFDHIGTDKLLEISKLRYQNVSLETIQAEIDKCELVCACCHRLRTKHRAAERRLSRE